VSAQTPTPGRIVTFRGMEGEDWPAMVTSVDPEAHPLQRVNLQIFAEPAILYRADVPHTQPFEEGKGTGPSPGSWRWPTRV
jgi:hypothetical protein